MNSDVVLKDDSFKKSINHFKKNKKLFAVGFAQEERDGRIVGANRGYFQNGFINHSSREIKDYKTPTKNFWAEGGASIFRRNIFLKIEMLDELFNPFYWEDIDLSYRAWKMGYEIIFDPTILVEHHHESTIGKYFQQKNLKQLFEINFFFHWKNITDKDILKNHLINLPKHIFKPGFFDALLKLPEILKKRKKQ